MTAPSPVSERGIRAQERILRAAATDLAAHGAIEVSRVARRAGVSEGLPYRYFQSRSGLTAAVVDDFHLRLGEAVVYADLPGLTWQERERERVRRWVQFLFADPLSPVMLNGPGADAEVAVSWQRRLVLAIEIGARNIAAAQRAGDLPAGNDATLLAATVLGGVQAAVASALVADPRPDEEYVADALWTFVRGAAEATPRRAGRRAR